jgi:LysR family hydrogen peroxide-inducible transcriptional activator
MNIQQFNYVLAVVDERNFELAAAKCFVTQSTLSTMIGRFEDEIGIRIFNRKTKPVSITPEGLEIIERLRILSYEVDSLENLVQELKGEMKGELKIGVIPTISPYLMPLFLSDLANKFPKIKIIVKELTTPEIQKALKLRNIDIGILALPLNDEELLEVKLFEEPFLVFNYTEKKVSAKIAIDNLDYSNLWLLEEGHCLRAQVHQICELSKCTTKNKINFEFESGSMDSLLRFTKANKGMTIVPFLASIDLAKDELLNVIAFEDPVPVRSVGLLTHKFFVKKRMLQELKQIIQKISAKYIPTNENSNVFNPLN